ncbi:MFS transporter [Actinoplanes sp. NPDC051346]|uniref:MFS transporter n=1 Tax=Actinoplanes sp. NPDC051346 TaxID=3155048 RepID=UPI003432BD02
MTSRRWTVLAVLCLAQLVVVLDNTVLTVAVPALSTSLGADTADIQWIINAYALVQCGLLLTVGAAADRFGRKRMLLLGLVLFGAASLAAGLAQSTGQLIAARAGLGIGGAMLVTGTLAVALQIFDEEMRPTAIGIWAAVSALGYAAGPPVGGLILAHFTWGAIFLLNLPVVALAAALTVALVPESRNPAAGRPDLPGAALATAGMTSVVYAIIAGSSAAALAGLLLLGGFLWWETRTAHPMLDLRLFRNRRFSSAVAGVVLITFGCGGALFLLTQQLQFVVGYTPLETGLRMAPFALSIVALNFTGLSAALIRRLGAATAIAAGMTSLAVGLAVVAHLATDGYPAILAGLLLMGCGCAVANPAIIDAVMSAIPGEAAGAGAGIDGTMSEVGTSLGIAALGAVLDARFGALLPGVAASFPAAMAAAGDEAQRARTVEAMRSALETGELVGAVAVLSGGLLTGYLLRGRRSAPAVGVGSR